MTGEILFLRLGVSQILRNRHITETQGPRKVFWRVVLQNVPFKYFLYIQLQWSYFLSDPYFTKSHPRQCPRSGHRNLNCNQEAHNCPRESLELSAGLELPRAPRRLILSPGSAHFPWCLRCTIFDACI